MRIGELSRELEKSEQSKGARHDNGVSPTKTKTLEEAGINPRTAERYEQPVGGGEEQAQAVANAAADRIMNAQWGDPIKFIISQNINRRHLSKGQRAMATGESIPGILADAAQKTGRPKSDFEVEEIGERRYEKLKQLLSF